MRCAQLGVRASTVPHSRVLSGWRFFSSVVEARHKIFGWALLGAEDVGMKFKSLKRLKRRGLIGAKVCSLHRWETGICDPDLFS